MEPLIDYQGKVVPNGALITWYCADFDDCTTWKFYGIVRDYTQNTGVFYSEKQCVIYMGGGIDFGRAIGKEVSFDEVRKEADNNEPYNVGIRVVGTAHDVVKLLGKTYNV
jgi:hypothetical protein